MKTNKILCSISLLFLFLSLQVHAESPVWKVEKDGNQIFIGGTLHLLIPEDYPLPAAFENAYNQSAKVVFETDVEKLQSPEYQQSMLRTLSYSDGRNLQQVLRKDTYLALEEFFARRGVPMTSVVNFKPGMVAMLMTIVELQRLGLVGTGVDAYFSEKTVSDQKKRGQLETVEEQLEFIANMGAGKEDEMLTYNITDLERLPSLWQSLKEAWRNGDTSKLKEVAVTPLKSDYPELYRSLLIERNDAWMPKIEAMLKTKEVEFVLVGALHLVGDHGLLTELATRGFKIKQLP